MPCAANLRRVAGILLVIPVLVCAQPSLNTGSSRSPSSGQGQKEQPAGFKELLASIGRLATEELRDWLGIHSEKRSQWDSNQSPRHSLFTFTTGMNDLLRGGGTDTFRVEKTLPDGFDVQSEETRALKQVLDRLEPLNVVRFPDTSSQAVPAMVEFEVFPYAVDHEWIWERLGHAPDGEIHLVRNDAGEWRFSRSTLENAPALLESMRSLPPVYPSQPHRDFLRSVFQPMLEETPAWGWAVLVASMGMAILVGYAVQRGLYTAGRKLENRTRPLVGAIFRSIGVSLAILAGTVMFVLGGSYVHFSELFSNIYWDIIQSILLVAVLWLLFGLTDLATTLIKNHIGEKHRNEYGAMTVTIIHRALNTVFFTILAVFLLENVFSLNIGALVTSLGVIGLAVSLAGKESAQNLFGAISIFTNRPFVVGDWVSFKDNLGEVHDVRMQATYIRLLSGEMLIVPNMQFVSNEVENLGMRPFLRREMDIALPYGTPPDKVTRAREVLDEVLRSDEVVERGHCNLETRPPIISFSEYGDYYLNLKVYYWYFIGEDGVEIQRNHERGYFTYLDHCTLVNQVILEAFDREDIEFAFPTRTIELERMD